MTMLTVENYRGGFLVDDELMGGITEDPQRPNRFIAFVLHHTTGEYLGYQPFDDLTLALQAINQIQRPWAFEKLGGCGGCNGAEGGCGKGKCGQGKSGGGKCQISCDSSKLN